MRFITHILFLSLAFLTGCASGFEENYQPVHANEMGSAAIQPCLSTKVEKMPLHESIDEAKARMAEQGYILIGEAQWESTMDESAQSARDQGKKVGACVVLWRRVEAGLVHTTQTVTEHIPGYSTTVTVKGSHGNERKTIDVAGRTVYHEEPVVYQRYDFLGLFFGKLQGYSGSNLGVDGKAPSTAYMIHNDSRRGFLVTSVQRNSPAFIANIFPGDVILAVNGKDVVYGVPFTFDSTQENVVLLDRNGKLMEKKTAPSYMVYP